MKEWRVVHGVWGPASRELRVGLGIDEPLDVIMRPESPDSIIYATVLLG